MFIKYSLWELSFKINNMQDSLILNYLNLFIVGLKLTHAVDCNSVATATKYEQKRFATQFQTEHWAFGLLMYILSFHTIRIRTKNVSVNNKHWVSGYPVFFNYFNIIFNFCYFYISSRSWHLTTQQTVLFNPSSGLMLSFHKYFYANFLVNLV